MYSKYGIQIRLKQVDSKAQREKIKVVNKRQQDNGTEQRRIGLVI